MCFVWVWEQTAIISLYSINWLVCITETECVYCAIRTEHLTLINSTFCQHSVFMCFVWIWEQTAIISLYNINWLVCITEAECVYFAVGNGSLNQTDKVSYLMVKYVPIPLTKCTISCVYFKIKAFGKQRQKPKTPEILKRMLRIAFQIEPAQSVLLTFIAVLYIFIVRSNIQKNLKLSYTNTHTHNHINPTHFLCLPE